MFLVLPLNIEPVVSHIIIFLMPKCNKSSQIAIPADPAPLIMSLISLGSFFMSLRPLMIAARVTTAVPC